MPHNFSNTTCSVPMRLAYSWILGIVLTFSASGAHASSVVLIRANTSGGNSSSQLTFSASVPDGELKLQWKIGPSGFYHDFTTASKEWQTYGISYDAVVDNVLAITESACISSYSEFASYFNALAGQAFPIELDQLAVSNYCQNISPVVAVSGGDKSISDTDGVAGETVSLSASATDSDGSVSSTEWLVGGSVVATGTSANLSLSDGATEVTFRATDNNGDTSSTSVTITVGPPAPTIIFTQGGEESEYLVKLFSTDLETNSHKISFAFTYESTGLSFSSIEFSGSSSSAVSASAANGNGTVEISGTFTSNEDLSRPFATISFSGEGNGIIDLKVTELLVDDNTANFDDPPPADYEIVFLPEYLSIRIEEDTTYSSTFQPYGPLYEALTELSVRDEPSHGEITLSENPLNKTDWTYNPTENYFGTDQFALIATVSGRTKILEVSVTITSVNDAPEAKISSGDKNVLDADGVAGEIIQISAKTLDSDGSIVSTEWLVGGEVVSTGEIANLVLNDGTNNITFRATDNDGETTSTEVTILVSEPTRAEANEWNTEFNGIPAPEFLSGESNSVSVVDMTNLVIKSCVKLTAAGEQYFLNGHDKYDMNFKLADAEQLIFTLDNFRPFNIEGSVNQLGELPDCSGRFELTTNIYQDIIAVPETTSSNTLKYNYYDVELLLTDMETLTFQLQQLNQLEN